MIPCPRAPAAYPWNMPVPGAPSSASCSRGAGDTASLGSVWVAQKRRDWGTRQASAIMGLNRLLPFQERVTMRSVARIRP
jgi:hypothetical protein